MTKVATISRIKLVSNLIIIFLVITGIMVIAEKVHTLVFNQQDINILKLDVPWHHPRANVAILFDQDALAENLEFYQHVQTSIFTYDLTKRIVYIPLLVLIFILLKKLIISINAGTFFKTGNIRIIRNLALVVGIYVVCGFIFYQLIPIFMPVDIMVETVNFSTFDESPIDNIVAAIDFKMLFVGIILYALSVSFREGYHLKQESEFTV